MCNISHDGAILFVSFVARVLHIHINIYEISPTTTNLDSYNQPSSGELAAKPVVVYMVNYNCWKWILTEINQISYV